MPNIPQKIRPGGTLLILWDNFCQNPKYGGLGALNELRAPEVRPRWVAFQEREGLKIWRIREDGLGCHAAVRCVLVANWPGRREKWTEDNSVRDNMIVPVEGI